MQRDLLRRDRRDEALERLDRDRRPQPAKLGREIGQDGLGPGEGVERVEIELGAEQLPHSRAGLDVERVHVDAPVGAGDPDLTTVDRAPERCVLPEVRRVASPVAKTGRRELEVVRVGNAQESHSFSRRYRLGSETVPNRRGNP